MDTQTNGRNAAESATKRKRRRRFWFGFGLVVLGIAGWLAFAALQVMEARNEALAGIRQIEVLQSSLTVDSIGEGRELDALRDVGAHFRTAHRAADHPLLVPLRFVPFVGRQVRSASTLAQAAADVTDIAERQFEAGRELLERREVVRAERVGYVGEIEALAAETREGLEGIDLGPEAGLVGPLRRARERFATELTRLERTADDVAVVSGAIGDMLAGPRTYLVMAANNAEMRSGSGAFLSVGPISIQGGGFELGQMIPSADIQLPDDRVPLTGDHAARWGWLVPNRDWRNIGATPRFDVNADLAAQMWQTWTGQAVDGVIALDVVALQALLNATGPVDVNGKVVSADSIVHEVLLQQYLDAETMGGADARRERLGDIASAVVNELEEGTWDPQTLANELVRAAEGRHLLAWSRHATEQQGWQAGTVSGELSENSLLPSLYNRSGNKLDQFVSVDATLRVERGEHSTAVEVTFDLGNSTPTGLPRYVAGPYAGGEGTAEGRYQALLAVNLPARAFDAGFAGVDSLVAAGADGPTRVVAAYVEMDRGGQTSLTLQFKLPPDVETFRIEPSSRLPAIQWVGPGGSWDDATARTVEL